MGINNSKCSYNCDCKIVNQKSLKLINQFNTLLNIDKIQGSFSEKLQPFFWCKILSFDIINLENDTVFIFKIIKLNDKNNFENSYLSFNIDFSINHIELKNYIIS